MPKGEVGVLNWQLGQGKAITRRERFVKGGELAIEHTHRPAIKDDVVNHQEKHVGTPIQLHQRGAPDRTVHEIECAHLVFLYEPGEFGVFLLR